MLFARVEEMTETSCSISIELLEADRSAAGRDDWDLTDDGMFSSRVDGESCPWRRGILGQIGALRRDNAQRYLTGAGCR